MIVTENHIINSLHTLLDLPKSGSAELFESLLEIIRMTLEQVLGKPLNTILIKSLTVFLVRAYLIAKWVVLMVYW